MVHDFTIFQPNGLFHRFSRAFSVNNGPIRVVLCEFWSTTPWSPIFYRMIGGRYWELWVSTFTFWRAYQNRTWKVLPKWRQASVEQTCKHFCIMPNFEESNVRIVWYTVQCPDTLVYICVNIDWARLRSGYTGKHQLCLVYTWGPIMCKCFLGA